MKTLKFKTNNPKAFKSQFCSVIGMNSILYLGCSYKGNIKVIVDDNFSKTKEFNTLINNINTFISSL